MKKLLYTLLLALSVCTGAYGMKQPHRKAPEAPATPNYNQILKRAVTYFKQGKLEEAKKVFQVVAEQNKNKIIKASALYNLGVIARKQYNEASAIKYWTAAANQNDSQKIRVKAMLTLVDAYGQTISDSKKIKYLKELATQNIDTSIRISAEIQLEELGIKI